ncbi:Signal transducer regulating beta-lactamase production, contains metallopeptidase domain [Flaviramulus basaltis]|uniref:Signal transducer regulating beta-lactamase production, contains metallopeptidase domain n=1 Tax=Flaviramulus basaltis TaxID=369401 RepID=A0A1K2IAI3_9FLAO|nr:M56 family metallopeptidase [Flaviramulus basaltis]SFZ89401.1 Signal transducer regulating beta-lactamase production, contains metallopeptidase domain [Flaviramulus basaltis]
MLLLILKSSTCLAVFMVFYKLCLEKTSVHTFKRFYLLSVILISITIPFITFTEYIESPLVSQINTTEFNNIKVVNNTEINTFQVYLPTILWSIYGLGVLLFSFRFIKNLYEILQKIKTNPKFRNSNYINVLLHDLITPHTFFNYIFLNKTEFEKNQIPNEVLLHEQTHAKQKHALDILFIEVFQILFWFNPLLHFIKKDIKLNHEFLADQAVLKTGSNTKNYQQLLLAFSSNAVDNPLANAINYPLIKKRFTVMKTKTSKTSIWIRSLLLLPLLAITLYGFSKKKEVIKANNLNIDYPKKQKKDSLINDIYILIDTKNQILLNDKLTDINNLLDDINKLNPNLTADQKRKFLFAYVKYQNNTSKELIKRIKEILNKTNVWGYSNINIEKNENSNLKTNNPSFPPLISKSQIKEEDTAIYNYKLNNYKKWLNENKPNQKLEETKNGYVIKNEEGKVSLSTDPSIKAEPFELKKDSPWKINTSIASKIEFDESENEKDLLPPPQPKITQDAIAPPPPPIPNNATPKQKAEYKKVIYEYEKKHKRKVHHAKTNDGEKINIVEDDDVYEVPIPQDAPEPPSPLDHVINMAKKGATFYYNNEKISSDKAIDLIKKNKDLNISTKTNNGVSVVKIQIEPISH